MVGTLRYFQLMWRVVVFFFLISDLSRLVMHRIRSSGLGHTTVAKMSVIWTCVVHSDDVAVNHVLCRMSGIEVEVDECYLTRRKYNQGRITKTGTVTILGLYERATDLGYHLQVYTATDFLLHNVSLCLHDSCWSVTHVWSAFTYWQAF